MALDLGDILYITYNLGLLSSLLSNGFEIPQIIFKHSYIKLGDRRFKP
jgi:hypothetical protein